MGRRSGPPDAQARIVRERAATAIGCLLVNYRVQPEAKTPQEREGLQWIGKFSPHDPRLYYDADSKRLKPSTAGSGRDRLSAFAEFVAEKSYGDETPSIWRRDLQGWLSKQRTVSPDKLRRLAQSLDASWIAILFESGYIPHLVVLIGKLLATNRIAQSAVVAGYVFRTWTFQDELITLDLFDPEHGLFNQALLKIERDRRIWPLIPARVGLEDVESAELRGVLRLCDPGELAFLRNDPYKYLPAPAVAASSYLLRRLYTSLDPFSAPSLKEAVNEVIASE